MPEEERVSVGGLSEVYTVDTVEKIKKQLGDCQSV